MAEATSLQTENTPPTDWAASFEPDTKGWLDGMGVSALPEKDALAKIIPMYRSAEQKLGVPADQLLRLPKEGDAEGFRATMTKLGLPETPDGYGLQAPDGQPGDFLKTATGWFHELGIPKGQAVGLAGKWNEYIAAQTQTAEAAFSTQAEKDILALKTEYGEDYDKNVELARRVRRSSGLSDDEAIAIERTLGLARSMKVFAELGKSLGEHRFVGGETGSTTFGMSPEAARARITDLKKDATFVNALMAGDADKKAEWTRLHKVGFPDGE